MKIAQEIQQGIAGMVPGERLPTVRELMASHGVSQQTVQRALGFLKEEGLIEAQVGRGTFVSGRALHSASRDLLVLSHEQHSDRADEMTRSMHNGFLKREWRSAILSYTDWEQAMQIVAGSSRLDACVLQPRGRTVSLNLLATLRARSQTVVVEGYSVTSLDVDSVAVDWPSAVFLALRHLVDLGHSEIALVTQASAARSFTEVCAEFRRLHSWAGLPTTRDPVIMLPAGPEDMAFEQLRQVLATSSRKSRPPFTACIAYPQAFHGARLLSAFERAGLSVPGDVSVVTMGYTDLVHEHAGRLDTVGQSTTTVTEAVAAAIEKRWQQPDASYQTHYLEPELVRRGSSARMTGRLVKGRT